MKRIKLFGGIFVLICLISTINVNALSNDLNSMDYTMQGKYIENVKIDNSYSSNKVKSEISEHNKLLSETKESLLILKKECQTKKTVLNQNVLTNENLKIWEVVLNSESFAEMMSNFNIIKTKKIIQDKSIGILEKREDLLMNKYIDTEEKLKELELNKERLEAEQLKINEIEADLKKKISRKQGIITFNASNLLVPSNMSVEDMYNVLSSTNLYDLAPVYIEAENIYGINALFIAGITAEESAWGTSKRAINDNNLTGLGVYSSSSNGINAQTKRDNILMTAKLLKNNYLTLNGIYYNGLSIQSVNTKYCIGLDGKTDYNWSEKISSIANNLLNNVKM